MFSFSRPVFMLALTLSVSLGCEQALAFQAPSPATSDSQPAAAQSEPTAPQTGTVQAPAQAPAQPTASSLSVQARIRARREQRRVAAIHEVYSHLYEAYVGSGFTRTVPGPGVAPGGGYQHYNLYMWNVGFTRYFNEKLGVTIDGRGSYGTSYIGNNQYNVNHPAISQYSGMIGPTYRFLLHPRYSVSGRILGGAVYGNFSGDTDGFGTALLGLYPDGTALAISASVPVEFNVSPTLGLRVAPEYRLTDFGSTIQNGWGLTGGFVYRFGKQ